MTARPKEPIAYRLAPWIAAALALFVVARVLGPVVEDSDASAVHGAPRTLRLGAAASLSDVMEEAVARWNEATGDEVEVVTGASSTLARQIQNGAPYDVFVSANAAWMETLVAERLAGAADVSVIAENRLVVITRLARGEALGDRAQPFDRSLFTDAFPKARWALGDPAHVPAGMYAKEALVALGAWEALEPRVVPASDVRAALRLVERGEVEFGIVYRTDAAQSARVTVVADVPSDQHTKAGVLVGRIRDSQPGAELLLAWLRGPTVRALLESRGFGVDDL
ncbi:Molybdate-binding periplasmic protein precursor [Planctomycetes bacterium Poly30]|uniref:Molybdate-binding periplasmic protein n=1 Tax=Saltatorellus ferox TaxID=2528018 RepID=A0A518EW25_9BACT|nr:Molybdate-binding periplasmic protein precursor [Planctomycetes bacterium Poly30]